MIYQYICPECGTISEYQSEFGQASDPEWSPPVTILCDGCEEVDAKRIYDTQPMEAVTDKSTFDHGPFSGSSQFQLTGKGFSRQDRRVTDHAEEIERIMGEDVSREEAAVGNELMEELEEAKGLPKGHLSGQREMEEIKAKELTDEERRKLIAKEREAIGKYLGGSFVDPESVQAKNPEKEHVMKKTPKRQGMEKLKQRAEEQRRLRK